MFHGMNYVMEVYKEQSFSKAAQRSLYLSAGAQRSDQEDREKDRRPAVRPECQPDPVDGVRERIYTDYGEDTGSGG